MESVRLVSIVIHISAVFPTHVIPASAGAPARPVPLDFHVTLHQCVVVGQTVVEEVVEVAKVIENNV